MAVRCDDTAVQVNSTLADKELNTPTINWLVDDVYKGF